MRTRRRFQPSLDSMPSRIAPSSIGLPAPTFSTAIHSPLTAALPSLGVAHPSDTSQSGDSNPIIIAPIPPTPPPSLPC
jgi:hypothetical protein